MPRPSKYPPESCERAIRISGESDRPITQVARDLGIHPETLRVWVRQDEADDGRARGAFRTAQREPRPAAPQRDPESRERVFRPRTRPAPSEVSAFVDTHRDPVGVEPMCREVEASASAYRARRTRPPSARAVRDEYLLTEIERVHAGSDGICGQLKIWDELSDEGITARCTVERLMRKNGVEGRRNGKTQVTTVPGSNPGAAGGLVRRDFTANRPDAAWLSDFTDIRT
ncbi:MAG: transposase [Actinomycetia bacterium]|nr:transposase [Actinomycetes bacterium]